MWDTVVTDHALIRWYAPWVDMVPRKLLATVGERFETVPEILCRSTETYGSTLLCGARDLCGRTLSAGPPATASALSAVRTCLDFSDTEFALLASVGPASSRVLHMAMSRRLIQRLVENDNDGTPEVYITPELIVGIHRVLKIIDNPLTFFAGDYLSAVDVSDLMAVLLDNPGFAEYPVPWRAVVLLEMLSRSEDTSVVHRLRSLLSLVSN